MTHPSTRRAVLATGAAALVVGCSKYGDENGGGSEEEASSVAPAESGTGGEAPAGEELTRTGDVPVGGGKIFKDEKVVVTQPEKGGFKAFSAVCTHQGCIVANVSDGTINCTCHGSEFRIADGSVAKGPAQKPLPAKQITVTGDSISLT
ncbi:Rieske Fe-S protein [Streptomyces phaeochromogenes]|jgi:Rieske Fe-S protein|uniref:Rieske (2Fe-2S) protein n=1 Tax=Streptomyces TaxID=1883 RepID=UPI00117F8A95|nr:MULTISPECIES: Rieske (2Fe-2S) protein [Streptomyces]MDQ0953580.1 Rieske Fe-S protein [Streptomyces phaeochromogenes]TRO66227.1 Rieske (2Fe-2S) protein [Streptomyces sp. IB201691-2A2]